MKPGQAVLFHARKLGFNEDEKPHSDNGKVGIIIRKTTTEDTHNGYHFTAGAQDVQTCVGRYLVDIDGKERHVWEGYLFPFVSR